jgi:hypothetical protein
VYQLTAEHKASLTASTNQHAKHAMHVWWIAAGISAEEAAHN